MEFGVFILAQQRGYHQSSQQVIQNSIEQTVVAEQAGFNTAWYAEHHFNNYSLSPSPLMMIAHMAAKTQRIRLGSAVCILPLYHPARFLAEVGFVDTVSNGRLELGIGSGYQEFEFERFGVKIEDSGAIYNEFLDIIPKGLTQKIVEYDGKFLKLPPSSIAVRPVQEPDAASLDHLGQPRHPGPWRARRPQPVRDGTAQRHGSHRGVARAPGQGGAGQRRRPR